MVATSPEIVQKLHSLQVVEEEEEQPFLPVDQADLANLD